MKKLFTNGTKQRNMLNDLKLFIVEFGAPEIGGGYISFGGNNHKPLFVLAKSYDDAANKAIEFIESNQQQKSVIDSNGDLNLNKNIINVRSVKLACEEVVC